MIVRCKNRDYYLLSICKIKHPQTREWIDYAIYKDSNEKEYGRELQEFQKRFKPSKSLLNYIKHCRAIPQKEFDKIKNKLPKIAMLRENFREWK